MRSSSIVLGAAVALGLAACGMHRHDPGPALLAGLSHADPGVLARATRTAGELRRRDLMAAIRAHRLHPDAATRFWANWATVQMGDEEALVPLRQFAEQPGAQQYRALLVLLAWQPRDISIAWVRQLMPQAQQRRMVIQAVGLLGEAAVDERCGLHAALLHGGEEHGVQRGGGFDDLTGEGLDVVREHAF